MGIDIPERYIDSNGICKVAGIRIFRFQLELFEIGQCQTTA
jgi:hypothetical protein